LSGVVRSRLEEGLVLGPLPPLYRLIVSVLALLAFVGVGAWLAFTLPIAVIAPTGAMIGAMLGALVVLGMLHEDAPRPSRVRARRHH
jgi:hypothetical protein